MTRVYLHSVLAIGLIAILMASFSPAYAQVNNPVVGQVTLVIGQADILRDDQRIAVKRGSDIRSGDEIETQATGHIYIHFVDDGLVTVRPRSRLQVQTYDYDEAHPENSTIRFNLQEGVVRSVSGKGAKAARQRYRLNTPIAAIGVRGTDFIVKADTQLTRAFVNEGAIVLAPFSEACQVNGLGPCNASGMELKGGSNQVLELDKLSKQPRLLQMELEDALGARIFKAQDGQALEHKQSQVSRDDGIDDPTSNDVQQADSDALPSETPAEPSDGGPSSGQQPDEARGEDDDEEQEVAIKAAVMAALHERQQNGSHQTDDNSDSDPSAQQGGTVLTPEEHSAPDHTSLDPSNAGSNVVVENGNTVLQLSADATEGLTPSEASTSPLKPDDLLMQPQVGLEGSGQLPSPAERQLVWGYWSDRDGQTPDFSFPYEQLKDGYIVKVRDGNYILMRRQGLDERMASGLGVVNFELSMASATLNTTDGGSQGLDVSAGALRINFAEGSFQTALRMGNQQIGEIEFSVNGEVTANGFISGSSDSTNLIGATSLDGQEAAYLFNHLIQAGQINGLTLWGAQ